LAKRYTLVEGDLHRCGTNGVIMWCITPEEVYELLTEVHGGECGNHASSCTLVGKAFQHRFYWPTTLQDAIEREQKALEDARAKILARELDVDARDTGLRDQEARLAAQER
jgi:hypothetical protein